MDDETIEKKNIDQQEITNRLLNIILDELYDFKCLLRDIESKIPSKPFK